MRLLVPLCVLALVAGCTHDSGEAAVGFHFDEQLYRNDIKTLASDAFEGRAPTTHGEQMTLDYLVHAFKSIGMQPGPDGSYLQKVPMVSYSASEQQQITLAGIPLQYRKDIVLNSHHDIKRVDIENAPLVFVGYGINAPEYGWNDYQGIDMHGKIALILVNDPGFANPDSGKFDGKAMTYYGRWTYKYEEASRQGAVGAIIIHQTEAASYPWSVVEHSWTGPQQDLVTENAQPRVTVEGWITLDAATAVFAKAGQALDVAINQAAHKPTQLPLGQTATISFANSANYGESYNVVANLPGTVNADEHILFTGHWDHLGKDDTLEGDKIFNGAMDNASGVAGMLAIARQFTAAAKAGHGIRRSVTFVVTTGEEQGLLGSRYYAEHPLFPLEHTIGVFNLDSTNIYGKTKDFTIVGKGKSELELYLTAAVNQQQRQVKSEQHPESGGYFRSDHFSFAKYGVPAVFAGGGNEPIDEATAKYKEQMQQRMKGCYHNTCDEYQADWDLSGALQDLAVYYRAATMLGNSDAHPGYYEGTEFYSLRPATHIKL
ncbi:M28 family metallopeptidase [Shewanella fodinae]|uniref:M28 family metallopeptidase n=1 Tax=Shewanella fodinae TaxID=552357 RepID=UPI0016790871|nr:M28 family metallopeptidase [Shewanella fodinae]MCL2905348.1 M28 family metallopeptidase [Shewanella fodinae]GGY90337.1 peptidase M28 [Shewanella fodinae]